MARLITGARWSGPRFFGSRDERPPAGPALCRLHPQILRGGLQLGARFAAVIKAEYRALSDKLNQVPRYHEVDRLQYNLSSSRSESQNWRVFFLEAMGRKAVSNRDLCPQTAALVDAIPGVFEALFSILEGGKSLAPHRSSYWGYLRYHLALEVPEALPSPRMRVNDRGYRGRKGRGSFSTTRGSTSSEMRTRTCVRC